MRYKRSLIAVAIVIVLSLTGFAASRTHIVQRWTRLPSIMATVSAQASQYGNVSTRTYIPPRNLADARRLEVDASTDQRWAVQVKQTNGCKLLQEVTSASSRLTAYMQAISVRSKTSCQLNLSGFNPAGIRVVTHPVEKAVEGTASEGYPYWTVEAPLSRGGAACEERRADKTVETSWVEKPVEQSTVSEISLPFKDEAAATSVAEALRTAAYICGATDNPEQLKALAESEKKKKAGEDATRIMSLISKNEQFAVCRIRHIEFFNTGEQCDPHGVLNTVKCKNNSTWPYRPEIILLIAAGLVEKDDVKLYYEGNFSNSPPTIYWSPSLAGRAAIGTEIKEERLSAIDYKWTLVLGCREIEQLDGTTALADGAKVDFSWKWKPTTLGTADGISEARQRGVAYLKRSGTNLVVDQVDIR